MGMAGPAAPAPPSLSCTTTRLPSANLESVVSVPLPLNGKGPSNKPTKADQLEIIQQLAWLFSGHWFVRKAVIKERLIS